MKTARDFAFATRGIDRLKVIASRTCHPSIDKAGAYLGVEVVRVREHDDFTADVAAVEMEIDDRTIMLVGSAPGYTHGVFDPIERLGELALNRNLLLHVDACLGGFLAPFARELNCYVPDFDFAVPGVTSLSADLHKYGMSAKGASLILYRDGAMKELQRFETRNWPRGVYSSETFLGSRPAGSVASAWAVMNHLGRAGYRRLAKTIIDTKHRMIDGIEAIEGLAVVHPSELCMLLYRSVEPGVDINRVAELLQQRGWFVGRAVDPISIQLALNPVHEQAVGAYLTDLAAAVNEARASGAVGKLDEATY